MAVIEEHCGNFVTNYLPDTGNDQKITRQFKEHLMEITTFASSRTSFAKQDGPLRAAAEKLEATFLAEMLKAAGLDASRSSFGGGAGEDQFASFLLQEQAYMMVRSGGIGLSETIFEALKEKQDDT